MGLLSFKHWSVPLFSSWCVYTVLGCSRESFMMNVFLKSELIEGLMIRMVCWKHTLAAHQSVVGCIFLIIWLFSSRLYHTACFGNAVLDTWGVAFESLHSQQFVPSFWCFPAFWKWTQPFHWPSLICSGSKHSELVLAGTGMNGSIILGADSSGGMGKGKGWGGWGLPLNGVFFQCLKW